MNDQIHSINYKKFSGLATMPIYNINDNILENM